MQVSSSPRMPASKSPPDSALPKRRPDECPGCISLAPRAACRTCVNREVCCQFYSKSSHFGVLPWSKKSSIRQTKERRPEWFPESVYRVPFEEFRHTLVKVYGLQNRGKRFSLPKERGRPRLVFLLVRRFDNREIRLEFPLLKGAAVSQFGLQRKQGSNAVLLLRPEEQENLPKNLYRPLYLIRREVYGIQ